MPAARPAVTPGPLEPKSERPQTQNRQSCGRRCGDSWKRWKKKVWSEAKGFRIVLKIGTEIYSKDALVMLRCHWIWSL